MTDMADFKPTFRPKNEFVEQLQSDFDLILRDELRSKGYDPDVITDQADLVIAYDSMRARRVESRPRRVHINPDLVVSPDVKAGFDMLIDKFRLGADVNPHLSRLSATIGSLDPLFYDWRINHFHLGTVFDADGFVRRTGPVAFAVVNTDDVYIVNIGAHGTWTDIALLEVIDTNWPEVIADSRVDGTYETIDGVPGNDKIKVFRKARINTVNTLSNGHSYLAVGGGYSLNGMSSLAVMDHNRLMRGFNDLYGELANKLSVSDDGQYVARYGTTVNVRLKRSGDDLMLYFEHLNGEIKYLKFAPLPV